MAFPVVLGGIFLFYYLVNPARDGFPVKCLWRVATGTLCPSCGTQRALYALTHGHLAEALSYNYFVVLSVPFVLVVVAAEWYNYGHKLDGLRRFTHSRHTLRAYVVLFFAWWIGRNVLGV